MRLRSATAALTLGLAAVTAGCGSTTRTAASGIAPADTATTVARAGAETAIQQAAGDDGGRPDGGRIGGRGPGGAPFGDVAAAATVLGVTETELRTELQKGTTLKQLADARGVSVQAVIDAMVASAKAHFADEVASGEHTQAEMDQMMARAVEMATAVANGQQPAFGRGDDDGPDGDGDRAAPGAGGPDQASGTPRKARTTPTSSSPTTNG